MGKISETPDSIANVMSDAANANDGLTMAKIMKDVGSCYWSSLIRKANQGKEPSEMLSIHTWVSGSDSVQVKVSKPYQTDRAVTANELVTISDYWCENKK